MKHHPDHPFEAVIGLEIHVELNTKSKLFSGAPNRFGDEPNTNISEVCTGQPGALPVLNREAVKKAVQFGCAIQAEIALKSSFDRKSYFYPDSPRNFQITQFAHPIVIGGVVTAEIGDVEKTFEVDHVHLEDDAGMLKHFSSFAGVDYNRAGVPLIEIVSKPCMHSPREAAAYASAVKAILQYIDASDCNMEEGSLRVDANISVRLKGEKGLRPKIEIKNMNSFSNMEFALEAEIWRQIKLYEANPGKDFKELVPQSTYRWDPETETTVLMRTKETADDYRYFPEPDLPPIVLTQSYVDEIRSKLPELPRERKRRYIETLSLSPHQAFALTADKTVADFFENALKKAKNPKNLANWILVEFPGRLKPLGLELPTSGITYEQIADLVLAIDQGKITGRIAKDIADEIVKDPKRAIHEIIASNPNFQPIHDSGAIQTMIDNVVKANPEAVADVRAGKEKAFAFLIGQIMKESKGAASPQVVNELLRKAINQVQ